MNSGWVRLLAPYTPRGGTKNPGMDLPLDVPADKNLAFLLYPPQVDYISYLSSIYPGGSTIPYTHTTEGLVVDIYKVSQEQWASTQGAMAHVVAKSGQGAPVRVSTWARCRRAERSARRSSMDGRSTGSALLELHLQGKRPRQADY